jgi:hypothetical protein
LLVRVLLWSRWPATRPCCAPACPAWQRVTFTQEGEHSAGFPRWAVLKTCSLIWDTTSFEPLDLTPVEARIGLVVLSMGGERLCIWPLYRYKLYLPDG